jgi:hypothetical protein
MSQAPNPNAFEVMIGKAYEENDIFDKVSFRYQRGPELSNKKKKAEGRAIANLEPPCDYLSHYLKKLYTTLIAYSLLL